MMTTEHPTVADSLGQVLRSLHGGPVFGVASSGNFELLTSFVDNGGDYVAACHEGGAVMMADGWAQVTGGVGVASVHQGPRLTNATTALCDAAKGRTPLVLLAPQLPKNASAGHQYVDQTSFLKGLDIGIEVDRLDEPTQAVDQLAAALRQAQTRQQTIVLQLPLDALAARVEKYEPQVPSPPQRRLGLDPGDVELVIEALIRSHAPLILAGRGVILADAEDAVRELAEVIGAPLVVTAPARGLFHGDPRLLGLSGGFTARWTRDHLVRADLILAIGASLDTWATAGGRLLGGARVIQVTTEAHRTKEPRAEHLDADAARFSLGLVDSLRAHNGWTARQWGKATKIGSAASVRADHRGAELDPRTLLREINRILPPDRVVALDSGHFIALAAMHIDVDRPRGSLFGQAFQSVGLGVSRAVGAAFARPEVVTTAIVGDGGFIMGMQELDTAVRAQLPVLIVIINDSAYGAEVHDFVPFGFNPAIAQFPLRTFAAIARGFGAEAATVEVLDDLKHLHAWLRNPRRPMVLDCRVDPTVNAVLDMTEEGAAEWSLTRQ